MNTGAHIFDEPDPAIEEARAYFAMLSGLATGLRGKLVLASFGEDLPSQIAHFAPAANAPDKMLQTACRWASDRGRNVYAAGALMRDDLQPGSKGREADVAAILWVACDFDRLSDEHASEWERRLPLPADAAVETSPGSFQALYVLDKPTSVDKAKPVVRALTERVGCDATSKDCSHVWRVPGFSNWPTREKIAKGRAAAPAIARWVKPWDGRSRTKLEDLEPALGPVPAAPIPVTHSAALGGTPIVLEDLPEDLRRLILEGASVGERSEKFHWAVAELKERGASPSVIEALLSVHPEGIAAKYVGRLRTEIDRCYAKATKPTPQEEFQPVDRPVSFADVLRRKPRPVQELVQGIVEQGIPTFLDGPGGSNKSRLALQIGLCLAAGSPVFGRTTAQCAFLYVSSEDDADEVARRAHAITRRLRLPHDSKATYWDRKSRDSSLAEVKEGGEVKLLPFHSLLTGYLKRTSGHKFVVLDSLYDFVRFVGKAKIDEGSVNAFIKQTLGKLCSETNSSALVIRHPSQAGAERGDFSGWSVANHNAPRARLSMSAEADAKDTYRLKVEKRNHAPAGETIRLHWIEGALLPRDALAEAEQGDRLGDAVVAAAKGAVVSGLPFTAQRKPDRVQIDEIEKLAGFRPTVAEIRNALRTALIAGRLKYIRGDSLRSAGYYPPEGADDAARALRRPRQGENPSENPVKTVGENRVKTRRKPGQVKTPITPSAVFTPATGEPQAVEGR